MLVHCIQNAAKQSYMCNKLYLKNDSGGIIDPGIIFGVVSLVVFKARNQFATLKI